jgi:hypothetical protein
MVVFVMVSKLNKILQIRIGKYSFSRFSYIAPKNTNENLSPTMA